MQIRILLLLIIIGTLCITAGTTGLAFGQSLAIAENNYLIYNVSTKALVDRQAIIDDAISYDVILFGEEHTDAVAHHLEHQLFQELYGKYGKSLALSLEIFDRDVQVILNEYLDGLITEKYFIKDSRAWNNYEDYQPLIAFAKDKEIDVIAANAPFRYANLARRQGQEGLYNLSDRAKSFISPLPYDTATGAHFDKLMKVIHEMSIPSIKQDTMATATTPIMPPSAMTFLSINQGQSLWNATMAYSIYQYLDNQQGKKIFHINGRFHSDEFFGVPQHLKKYNEKIRCLVISVFPDSSFPQVEFTAYEHLADYIIITDPAIPKSF